MNNSGFGDDNDAWAQPDSTTTGVDGDGVGNDDDIGVGVGVGGGEIAQFEDDGFGGGGDNIGDEHLQQQQQQQATMIGGGDEVREMDYFQEQDNASAFQLQQQQQQQQQQTMYSPSHQNGTIGGGHFGMMSSPSHHVEEVSPAVREYNALHQAQIEEREQHNLQKQQTTLQSAQAFLEAFHNDRQSKIEAHLSQIKQQENSFFSSQESLKHSNPWAAVVELSDLHKMSELKKSQSVVSPSSSSSKPGSATGSPIIGAPESSALTVNRHQKDVSRMKQLLIDLKNTPISPST